MDLIGTISDLQEKARRIVPPDGREPARGGLEGPAFFPEGLGLQTPKLWKNGGSSPNVMVVGHNFGSAGYRQRVEDKLSGREDTQPTWSNLASLLTQATLTIGNRSVTIDDCFMTNWFVGLLPGNKNRGHFLDPASNESDYERSCILLLREQIAHLRPRLILLLGKDVAQRSYRLDSELKCWNWKTPKENCWGWIHRKGPSVIVTSLTQIPIVVTALSHPSRGRVRTVLERNLNALASAATCLGTTDRFVI